MFSYRHIRARRRPTALWVAKRDGQIKPTEIRHHVYPADSYSPARLAGSSGWTSAGGKDDPAVAPQEWCRYAREFGSAMRFSQRLRARGPGQSGMSRHITMTPGVSATGPPAAARDAVISAEDPCRTEVQAPYPHTIPPRSTDLPR
jgi:hypothetical protein